MYDPKIGQFLSEDPIGFDATDANIRRYVGNMPTMLTDPSGLQPPAGTAPTPFPPPKTTPGFTPYSGQKAIIDYLKVKVEYRSGKDSETNCPKSTIIIGKDQSKIKQFGHIYHELVSILSYRLLGYPESGTQGTDVFRDAAFPDGRPINVASTGIHNLGLIVEFAAIAEFGPTELTPDYLEERFGTAVCRRKNDPNKDPILFEKKLKEMVKWIEDAWTGAHDGEIYHYEMKPWEGGNVADNEKVRISVYLEAKKSRIVGGKVHIILED